MIQSQSVRLLTEPIAKVHAFHVHLGEPGRELLDILPHKAMCLLLSGAGRHQQIEESILDISMAPVLTLNLRERSNVARAEGSAWADAADKHDQTWQDKRAEMKIGRHFDR